MIANKEFDNIFSLLRSYYSVKRRLWRGIETVTFLENVYRAEGGDNDAARRKLIWLWQPTLIPFFVRLVCCSSCKYGRARRRTRTTMNPNKQSNFTVTRRKTERGNAVALVILVMA